MRGAGGHAGCVSNTPSSATPQLKEPEEVRGRGGEGEGEGHCVWMNCPKEFKSCPHVHTSGWGGVGGFG